MRRDRAGVLVRSRISNEYDIPIFAWMSSAFHPAMAQKRRNALQACPMSFRAARLCLMCEALIVNDERWMNVVSEGSDWPGRDSAVDAMTMAIPYTATTIPSFLLRAGFPLLRFPSRRLAHEPADRRSARSQR